MLGARRFACPARGREPGRDRLDSAEGVGAGAALSVADGHGSPRASAARPARGWRSRSPGTGRGVAGCPGPSIRDAVLVKDRLEQEPPAGSPLNGGAWYGQHLAETPFTEQELGLLRERDGPGRADLVRPTPTLPTATTLITAVTMDSLWRSGRSATATSSPSRPPAGAAARWRGDDRLIANETTSLCTAGCLAALPGSDLSGR